MRRAGPLLFVLVALVAVLGVAVVRDPPAVAGAPVAAAGVSTAPTSTAPTTTTASTTTTTTTAAPTTTRPPSTSLAGRIKPGEERTGIATFYDSDGGGACSYDPGPDPLTTAVNAPDFEGSAACGAHLLVRAGGQSVTVRVTNLCPECRAGHLDLSAEAFARLAPPVKGEIPITWTLVSPQTQKPVAIRYKSGSSQYWCGIQVIDHRNPVARLEVRAGGQWRRLERAEYNYFLSETGAGCGGALAITDVHGERLEIPALPVRPGATQTTNVQFAAR
ncbi:expansin EXLX1 family cellulose-binding protein [Lentzea sp. NPDC060358]|uniref:expansin EXLX1 family cellulose-binding protein n=1 Tax=Lentzea sp. NPDC060358 TaxID=3347103 RepID=UPI003656A37B